MPEHTQSLTTVGLAAAVLIGLMAVAPACADVPGVTVALDEYDGPARVTCEAAGKHGVSLHLDPRGETEPLTIRVEVPTHWPVEDLWVTDADGGPLAVRRRGIEWHRLFIPVPPAAASYLVAPAPGTDPPQLPPESARTATDPVTGLQAEVCRWHDGRTAALSIRFDDAHPTHLSTVIPILREHGLRGTFMINPGTDGFLARRDEWEACAARDDQEFANHTMHHRGAASDDEVRTEVGAASEYIWSLFPHRSRLLALNRGGGTTWVTARPFREFLDEYHLFVPGGSLGMDDVYGERIEALRAHLNSHLERGLWCRIHYHSIGEGLAASEANFRAAMELIKQHQPELWIAGMADIHKYQSERAATALSLENVGPTSALLRVACLTDPDLYDQPLTIRLALPEAWRGGQVTVADAPDQALATRAVPGSGDAALMLDVPPAEAEYLIRPAP